MNNKLYSHLRLVLVLALFTVSTLIYGSAGVHAQSNRSAYGIQSPTLLEQISARRDSEISLLVKVDLTSKNYEIVGSAGKFPDDIEPLASSSVGNPALALVSTGTDEIFIRPIAVRFEGSSNVILVVPFSNNWNVQEITLIGIPAAAESSRLLGSITLSSQELISALSGISASVNSPEIKIPFPMINCFPIGEGCSTCTSCVTIFGVEFCSEWQVVC